MQKLFAALALLSAIAFAQIPELLQQYRQRIGGAADELTIIVANFDEDARRSTYDRASALAVMTKSSDRLIREQGQRMWDYVQRLDRLNSQQAALAKGVTLGSTISVALDYDQPIMSQAWNAYTPAFPTTITGIVFAIIGWIVCYGALLGLGFVFGPREEAAA